MSSSISDKRAAGLLKWGLSWIGPLLLTVLLVGPLWGQSYEQGGRRDPFANPAHTRQVARRTIVEPPPLSQRPAGLSGLLVSEVTVVGTAANKDRRIVILQGTDNFTYMAREETRLFDGYVESISSDEVVFIREIFDNTGQKTTRKVVKRFYTETSQGD